MIAKNKNLSSDEQKKADKGGFWRSLLRAPEFENPAQNRIANLQYTILIGLLITDILGVTISLAFWSENSIRGLQILIFEFLLVSFAFYWLRRGYLEVTSWILVGTFYVIFLLALSLSGFTFPIALLLALVISLAGLLLRYYSVVAVTVFTMITVWTIPYITSVPTQLRSNELGYVLVILALVGLLLTVASNTLEKSFAEADRSKQDLLHANSDLQTFNKDLEQRVADRTRNLELAAEVGRTVSQVHSLDVMLTSAAELIRTQFDLYYVQVYLVNPSKTALILQSGTGQVGAELLGRNHQLSLNSGSINGRAAVEKKSVVISDTTTSPTFRPNPLLPDTRSEMAVPLLIGEKVVGVLDMQSEHAGALNADSLSAFEALAGQLAIAIQNATLLAEAEQARVEVETRARSLIRTNWNDYLDAIHQPEETGFVFTQNQIEPMTDADQSQISEEALSAPIEITGESLGNLVVELEGQSPIVRTNELINSVARQVGQHIESLRLLDNAERYRFEAEQASRRLTRENWQEYKQANTDKNLSYLYDQKEVRAYNHEGNEQPQSSDLNLPLKIRDEEIGQVVVQGMDVNNLDNLNLASAVVERLSQHIESLRLLEKTEESRSEIQTSQERLSEALGIAKLANWEYDVEKDLFEFNDNFYAVLHTTVQEVGGYQLASADYASRFVHPEDVPIVGVEIGKALSSTERHFSSSVEHRVIFADGEIGYLSVSIQVERDEEGKITRYYGANQDVTERRRAEEELRTREAQLSAVLKQTEKLFEASRRLTQVGDLQELVKTTVEIFDISVINGAELDLFSYDFRGDLESLTVIANWWNGTGTAPGAVGSRFSKEMFSAVKLFLTSTPVFISDALDSERVDAGMMRIVKAFNIRAVTFLPLFIGANQIGVLVMHAEETHDFTEDETRLFSGLAPQIATVLENRNQYQRAQQQAERESTLNTISQKIQSATTVEAVLQIAARELGHALGAPMTIAQLSMKDKK